MSNPHVTATLAQGALVAGKYRLLRQLGEGAMGVVWSARNEQTLGQVALKLIVGPEPELRLQLLREAQACCKIHHKNVIQIHDVGQTDSGDPFLVMELLSGETLAELLGRARRLNPREAAVIGRDVARALGAAHDKGIVHRDLKPANIFLHNQPGEDARVVKVLDFGVSKNLLAADGLRTMLGGPIGSPSYMSPEQARAERDIDARADIWSLGVVLFEMLTGERPFTGEAQEVIDRIASAEIPLASRRVRSVEPGLDRLISACLTRDREQRLWPISEVEKGLEPFTADLPRSATPTLTAVWGASAAASAPPSSRSRPAPALPSEDSESGVETRKLDVAMLSAARSAPIEPPPRALLLPGVPLLKPYDATVKMFPGAAPGDAVDAGDAVTRPLTAAASSSRGAAVMSATAPPVAAAVNDPGSPASLTSSWTGPTPLLEEVPPGKESALVVARALVGCVFAVVALVLAFTHPPSRAAAPASPTLTTVVEASPAGESAPLPPSAPSANENPVLIQAVLAEPAVAEVPPPPSAKQESEARPPPRVAAPKPPVKCGRFVKTGCVDATSSR
jgi:serine/threonine protein kinase